jgi:hypothetical protein
MAVTSSDCNANGRRWSPSRRHSECTSPYTLSGVGHWSCGASLPSSLDSRIESVVYTRLVEHVMTAHQRALGCPLHAVGRTVASPAREEYGSRERCQARSAPQWPSISTLKWTSLEFATCIFVVISQRQRRHSPNQLRIDARNLCTDATDEPAANTYDTPAVRIAADHLNP